ncbi:hypothetical protein [Vibrio parahaemolyticus]|uniref:hypothetical protein n=1 Tax=Vibrio parahaemolyticus TaxID=670 RepID=UPI000943EF73|nr:hypothetical protein [Vibrio parahaemolyticus]MBE3687210.1 hypothetical protein [Vibrio parahaemolyticus]MBE3803985.1 hypothetical protein [Vibrio parahaemolyticus]MBE3808184.1 hypothetical protein [Vibrio parahaemolyticus]MBE4231525.1 hypothetical protein [Vibrio parahaemolyticus]MBE4435446.1 hypothetical protein [Vibrio parahaemolyticus]
MQPTYRKQLSSRVPLPGMKCIFIGTDNWDLYVGQDGRVWAYPKPDVCRSVKTSFFGDRNHLLRLMRQGVDLGDITDDGLELLNGLYHCFMPGWYWLKFS